MVPAEQALQSEQMARQAAQASAAAQASMYGSDRQFWGLVNQLQSGEHLAGVNNEAELQRLLASLGSNQQIAGLNSQTQLGVAGLNSDASRYGADQSLAASQAAAAANRYGSDQQLAASQAAAGANRYGSELGLQGQLGVAGMGLQGQMAGYDAQRQIAQGTNSTNLGIAQGNNQTQLGTANIGANSALQQALIQAQSQQLAPQLQQQRFEQILPMFGGLISSLTGQPYQAPQQQAPQQQSFAPPPQQAPQQSFAPPPQQQFQPPPQQGGAFNPMMSRNPPQFGNSGPNVTPSNFGGFTPPAADVAAYNAGSGPRGISEAALRNDNPEFFSHLMSDPQFAAGNAAAQIGQGYADRDKQRGYNDTDLSNAASAVQAFGMMGAGTSGMDDPATRQRLQNTAMQARRGGTVNPQALQALQQGAYGGQYTDSANRWMGQQSGNPLTAMSDSSVNIPEIGKGGVPLGGGAPMQSPPTGGGGGGFNPQGLQISSGDYSLPIADSQKLGYSIPETAPASMGGGTSNYSTPTFGQMSSPSPQTPPLGGGGASFDTPGLGGGVSGPSSGFNPSNFGGGLPNLISGQQQDQMLNNAFAGNAQTAATQMRNAQSGFGGRGWSPTSPALRSFGNRVAYNQMGADTQARTQIPLQVAQTNGNYGLQAGQLGVSQYNARTGAIAPLLGSLASLV
jgi:hypothetical protein